MPGPEAAVPDPPVGGRKRIPGAVSILENPVRRSGAGPAWQAQTGRQAMRVMVFVKATGDSEKGAPPAAEMIEAMGRFNAELHTAGVLLMAEGLKPTMHAKRVAFDGPGRTVIDGPFAETRELVAGFWLWEVKDMDEAVAWVRRCPNPMPGPSEIEIRPLFEMAEFEKLLPPHIAALGDDRVKRWEALHARDAASTGT
jgi:hypothetical protein